MPHNRTMKWMNDCRDSDIWTEIGSMSYLKKIPGTIFDGLSSGAALRESVTAYWLVMMTSFCRPMYVVGT